jgi:hypothetical protein
VDEGGGKEKECEKRIPCVSGERAKTHEPGCLHCLDGMYRVQGTGYKVQGTAGRVQGTGDR